MGRMGWLVDYVNDLRRNAPRRRRPACSTRMRRFERERAQAPPTIPRDQAVRELQRRGVLPADYRAPATAPEPRGSFLGDVAANALPSLVGVAKDVTAPIHSPVKTISGLWGLAAGLVQKVIPGEQANEADVDAVGRYLADRYSDPVATFRRDPPPSPGSVASRPPRSPAPAMRAGREATCGSASTPRCARATPATCRATCGPPSPGMQRGADDAFDAGLDQVMDRPGWAAGTSPGFGQPDRRKPRRARRLRPDSSSAAWPGPSRRKGWASGRRRWPARGRRGLRADRCGTSAFRGGSAARATWWTRQIAGRAAPHASRRAEAARQAEELTRHWDPLFSQRSLQPAASILENS